VLRRKPLAAGRGQRVLECEDSVIRAIQGLCALGQLLGRVKHIGGQASMLRASSRVVWRRAGGRIEPCVRLWCGFWRECVSQQAAADLTSPRREVVRATADRLHRRIVISISGNSQHVRVIFLCSLHANTKSLLCQPNCVSSRPKALVHTPASESRVIEA
jgi:hypothetical protein